jgi:hypothetical protein
VEYGAPTFMRNDIPIQRPALGELELGSPVVVHLPRSRRRGGDRYVPAQVSHKARVWITVEETGREHPNSWHLRLDTQDDGSDSNYRTRFRTPEQQLHEDALSEAHRYLTEQGITLEHDSPWRKTAWDTIRLARMLWRVQHDVDG